MRHAIDASGYGMMDDPTMQPVNSASTRLRGDMVAGVEKLFCGVDDGNYVYGSDGKALTKENLIRESGYLLAQCYTFQRTLSEYDTWLDGEMDTETRSFQESYEEDIEVIQKQLALIPSDILQEIQGLFDQLGETNKGLSKRKNIL